MLRTCAVIAVKQWSSYRTFSFLATFEATTQSKLLVWLKDTINLISSPVIHRTNQYYFHAVKNRFLNSLLHMATINFKSCPTCSNTPSSEWSIWCKVQADYWLKTTIHQLKLLHVIHTIIQCSASNHRLELSQYTRAIKQIMRPHIRSSVNAEKPCFQWYCRVHCGNVSSEVIHRQQKLTSDFFLLINNNCEPIRMHHFYRHSRVEVGNCQ